MKMQGIYLCLLMSLFIASTEAYFSGNRNDHNGDHNNNNYYDNTYYDNNNNNNGYDYNSGGRPQGKDKSGKVTTRGKFVAIGNTDKGSNYHQVTFFHKGSRYKKKFTNYETKGKVYSYGRQKLKAKFGIESRLKGKNKFNGVGKFNGFDTSSYLPTQYGEGSNTAESLIPTGEPAYSPSSYDYASNEGGEAGEEEGGEGQAPPDNQPPDNTPSNTPSAYDYYNNEGGNGQGTDDYESEGQSYNGDSADYHTY